jgi:hypothetical protein
MQAAWLPRRLTAAQQLLQSQRRRPSWSGRLAARCAGRLGALSLPALPAGVSPAPEDERLHGLMRDVLQHGPENMLAPMFHALDQAGQRLPYALLVERLNEGRRSVELRTWLTPVLGERGRWLAGLNPQWSYASGVQETANAELIWQEGSIEQRVALLHSERETDADQAAPDWKPA